MGRLAETRVSDARDEIVPTGLRPVRQVKDHGASSALFSTHNNCWLLGTVTSASKVS